MFKNYWVKKQAKIEAERTPKEKLSKPEYYAHYFRNINTIDEVKNLLAVKGYYIELDNDNKSNNVLIKVKDNMPQGTGLKYKTLFIHKDLYDYGLYYLLHTFYHALESEMAKYDKRTKLEQADVFAILLLERIRPNNFNEYIPDFIRDRMERMR